MPEWKKALAQGALAGSLVSLLSTAVLGMTYAALSRNKPALRTTPGLLLGAAATSATACLVGCQLTPERLTTGSERRLSTQAAAGVYAALAIGLAAGALALRDRYRGEDEDEADEAQEQEAPPVIRRVRAGHI